MEEGGNVVTELPMCNCGKPSVIQMLTTEKNPGRQFWGCKGRNLYENKSIRM